MAGRFPTAIWSIVLGVISGSLLASPVPAEPRTVHTMGNAAKKGEIGGEIRSEEASRPPLLATLVQTHSDERVQLDEVAPPHERFDALLADRVTGGKCALDPRLLELLRTLLAGLRAKSPDAALPRVELVSGFRSPKLNEMLRKKGHHVASHSQHSLGHAVDFRIVLDGEARGIDPRDLASAIRAAGWAGGVGIYLLKDDWFVHADVGPNRSWNG